MSRQDEATTPQKVSAGREPVAARRLLCLLRSTTVPLKEGGGVVFPKGFPRRGYRLDDWQFDRYRAGLENAVLGEGAKKRSRAIIAILVTYAVLIFAANKGIAWLGDSGLYDPKLIAVLPGTVLLLLIAAALFALHLTRRSTMGFAKQFQDAPRVNRFDYLRQRVIAVFAAGIVKPVWSHLLIPTNILIVLFLFTNEYVTTHYPGSAVFVSIFLVYYALKHTFLCSVYWSFRLARGRAPAAVDLGPV